MMMTPMSRIKPWLVVATLAVLLGGSMVAGGRTAPLAQRPAGAAVLVQGTPLTPDDEAWVQTTAQQFCDHARQADDEEIDCLDPSEFSGFLRDCLMAALGVAGLSQEEGRRGCAQYAWYAQNAGASQSIGDQVETTIKTALVQLASEGLDGPLVSALETGTEVRACLTGKLVSGAVSAVNDLSIRALCPSALAAIDAAWVEREVAAFASTLTPLLDQGRTAADLLNAETAFRACLDPARLGVGDTNTQRYSRADLITFCRNDVTVSQGLIAVTGGAPTAVSVSCSPLFVSTGEPATCTGSVVGPYTGLQWSAPAGSPNTGTDPTFTTRYDTGGVKTVELTACNTVQPDNRQLCTVGSATVAVNASAPVITALSCAPTQVAVRSVVNCTADVGGAGGAITRRWSAPSGDPADGRGPSFSTAYNQAGPKTITFRTCNGPDPRDGAGGEEGACTQDQRTITVTAAPTPTPAPTPTATPVTRCTRLALTGTWNTMTSNQGEVSFTFQQTGTTVTGSVTLPAAVARNSGYPSPTGTVQGTYVGDRLDINLTFTGPRGPASFRYVATIVQTVDTTGQAGTGRLQSGNSNGGTWTGSGPMRCAF